MGRLQHKNQTRGRLRHFYSPLTPVVQVPPTDLGLPLSLGGLPDPTRKMKRQRQRVTGGPSSSSSASKTEPLRQGLGPLLLACYQIQRSLSPHMLFPAPLPVLRWGLADPFLLEGLADQGTRQCQELPGDQADPGLPGTETAKGGGVPAGPVPGLAPERPLPPISSAPLPPAAATGEGAATYLQTWRTNWPRWALDPDSWVTLRGKRGQIRLRESQDHDPRKGHFGAHIPYDP